MATGYDDREAAGYDESRGGTGIVAAELAAQGRDVVVVDLSTGMLRLALERLPGRVAAVAAGHGLRPVGEASFSGRSPGGSADDGDPVFPLVALVKG